MRTLFDDLDDDIQKAFWIYHERNPGIYVLFRKFAGEARDRGRTRYSADAVVQRIRWHFDVETVSTDNFKINNNFASRYARLLMALDDSFAGFFELRELTSKKGK